MNCTHVYRSTITSTEVVIVAMGTNMQISKQNVDLNHRNYSMQMQKKKVAAFGDVSLKLVEYYSMNSAKLGKFSECVRFVTIGVLAEVSEQQIYLGFPIPDKTYHKLWLAIAV